MIYTDDYSQYLDEIPDLINKCLETGEMPALAYTSNLDVVLKWDSDVFSSMSSKYLKSEPSYKTEETMDTIEDFVKIVSYFIIKGAGIEVDITNYDVCRILEERFEYYYAIGGTCAHGSMALANVGVPILSHITDRSVPVCNIMNHPNINFVLGEKIVKAGKISTEEKPLKHYIVQYSKGDIIKVNGKSYTAPNSNRIILSYDNLHRTLPVDDSFLRYCEKNAKLLSSYNISGFNSIVENNILMDVLDPLATHYKAVKKENPSCVIFLEGAHYQRFEIRKMLINKLADCVDIFGMNEDELMDITSGSGISTNIEDYDSVLTGLDFVREKYKLKGMVLHTKDFSLYFGKDIPSVNIKKALTLGNLVSGTKSRTGINGGILEFRKTIEDIPLSKEGIKFANYVLGRRRGITIVPSRFIENPACTIGLGDAFVAGMQIGFI